MAHVLSCPSGHVWEISSLSDAVSLEIVPNCFHCGSPLTLVLTESAVASDPLSAALTPAVSSTMDPSARQSPSVVLPPTQSPSEAALSAESTGAEPVVASPPTLVSKWRPGQLVVGTRVADYQILGILGSGGMAIVYKARQLRLNRIVALKMILRGSHGDEKRFRIEARAVAKMQHPHIVQVYEIGDIDGEPFFSLEFCNGGNLNQKLKGVPLPPREAAALTEKLAEATHSAHERGILHRDLKPANVLLVGDEETPLSQCVPKIADFGLAKKLDADGSARTGTVMGTPSYMPPEQMRGETELKATVDVYSLGALLYELLVGRPPFRAATLQETMQQVLLEEPVPPRRLQSKTPRDLETICLKCLQKSPGKRYVTAKALADDLHRFLAGEPIRARPVGRIEKTIKWVKRRPTVTALAGFLMLALLAGFAGIGWKWRDAVAAQNRAELEAERAKTSLEMLADPFDEPLGIDGPVFRVARDAGENRRVQELLNHARDRLRRRDSLRPEVRAASLQTLGSAYRNLSLYEEAEACLLEALSLLSSRTDGEPLDMAACLHELGLFYHHRSFMDEKDYDQALAYYSKAFQIRKQHLPRSKTAFRETVFCIGWLAMETGDYSKALDKFDEVIRLHDNRTSRDRLLVWAEIGKTAAGLEQQLGEKNADSKQLSLKLLPGVAEMLTLEGDADWKQAYHLMLGGVAFQKKKQYAAAADAFRQCNALIRDRKGKEHYYRTIPLFFLADTLAEDGQRDEAARMYRECLGVAEKSVGLAHGQFPVILKAYAALLHQLGKTQEAHDYFERVLKAVEIRFGKTHFFVAHAKVAYAEFLKEINDYPRLQQQCVDAKGIYDNLEWKDHSRYKTCLALLDDVKAHNETEGKPAQDQ